MSIVFTCPGKLGDAILQLPVAAAYCKMNSTKCEVWLDEKTCKPLVPWMEQQPWIEKVRLLGGIQHYQCGGQPWDFGLKVSDHLDHEIVHLGFRTFPNRQITLETLANVPYNISQGLLSEEMFHVKHMPAADRLVLHGTYRAAIGTPGVWLFISDHWDELKSLFKEIAFAGTEDEVDRALELYPDAVGFKDGGDLSKTAAYIKASRCVIGAGSSMCALASVLKVPCIRIHDQIADFPKVIWSGLGANQLNETERDLRKLWPEWRDQFLAVPA